MQLAYKAFTDEIARMSFDQLWLMSDTAHY
jgi:hypothetical protein